MEFTLQHMTPSEHQAGLFTGHHSPFRAKPDGYRMDIDGAHGIEEAEEIGGNNHVYFFREPLLLMPDLESCLRIAELSKYQFFKYNISINLESQPSC